jgi:hypothetical protein
MTYDELYKQHLDLHNRYKEAIENLIQWKKAYDELAELSTKANQSGLELAQAFGGLIDKLKR